MKSSGFKRLSENWCNNGFIENKRLSRAIFSSNSDAQREKNNLINYLLRLLLKSIKYVKIEPMM